ncbi:MAG: hypothetical protein WA949_20080 [Phormidesmis sp.]
MNVLPADEPDKPTASNLAQQQLYDDLLDSARKLPPVESLAKFENLFFGHSSSVETVEAEFSPFLYHILFADNEQTFQSTLKRACYILVNNWDRRCQSDMVHTMLALFDQPSLKKPTFSPSLERLRQWLLNFAASQDFEALKLFAAQRIGPTHPGSWSSRYVTYQLTAQAIDSSHSLEQKEAARKMARRLKDKFKHELAMYTAFSQSSSQLESKYPNPTVLGAEVLRLIKAILLRGGQFSYRNVARIFQQQTAGSAYKDYKESLIEYLCFSIAQLEFVTVLETSLSQSLTQLYLEQDKTEIEPSLALRTCNRLIDLLTTEDRRKPSPLFETLLTQGNPLNLAVLMLKLVLISPNSQLYLEARLANVINYYRPYMEAECRNVVQLLEICNVMFAIYSDNVEYNLVRVKSKQGKNTTTTQNEPDQNEPESMEDFRIFSRSFRAAQKRASQDFQQRKARQVGIQRG